MPLFIGHRVIKGNPVHASLQAIEVLIQAQRFAAENRYHLVYTVAKQKAAIKH
jgi:hypothetical protein